MVIPLWAGPRRTQSNEDGAAMHRRGAAASHDPRGAHPHTHTHHNPTCGPDTTTRTRPKQLATQRPRPAPGRPSTERPTKGLGLPPIHPQAAGVSPTKACQACCAQQRGGSSDGGLARHPPRALCPNRNHSDRSQTHPWPRLGKANPCELDSGTFWPVSSVPPSDSATPMGSGMRSRSALAARLPAKGAGARNRRRTLNSPREGTM